MRLVADLLEALDLDDVTLVHTDWGGALFLTAHGLDARVGRMVILPCEAFGNFPPGLPGKMAALAARLPGGISLACRQLRIGWLRGSPLLFGQMAKKALPDELVRGWTESPLRDRAVRRDLRAYAREKFDKTALVRDTEALRDFAGPALVLWSPENRVMPPAPRTTARRAPARQHLRRDRGCLRPLDARPAGSRGRADGRVPPRPPPGIRFVTARPLL